MICSTRAGPARRLRADEGADGSRLRFLRLPGRYRSRQWLEPHRHPCPHLFRHEKFSQAVAIRMTPDADPKMTQETAFHPRFSALTRNYTEYRGYWLPTRFNNANADRGVLGLPPERAVMDLSPLRKFEVTGPDAEALLQLLPDARHLASCRPARWSTPPCATSMAA